MRDFGSLPGIALLVFAAISAVGQDTAAGLKAADPGSGSASAPSVTLQFERAGLVVPRFRMVVREDGSGSYQGDEVETTNASGGGSGTGPSRHFERQLKISPAGSAKIVKSARKLKLFNTACASKAKNIADTGTKVLSYEGPDGKGSCSYNYSENKDVVSLTEMFLGMAETMDEGRKLEFKRRYDHLGLDAQLDTLTQENDAGRAIELGTIAPLLRELSDDTELMERVRLRASRLLERANEGK